MNTLGGLNFHVSAWYTRNSGGRSTKKLYRDLCEEGDLMNKPDIS